MDITITTDRKSQPPSNGPATIGWFTTDTGTLSHVAPERVRFRGGNRTHAKSASRCPGVIQLESRYFLIRSPLDLDLRFTRDDNGTPMLCDNGGSHPDWAKHISPVAQQHWRRREIPNVRLELPYHFMSDEMCYLTIVDSFAHFRPHPLPGVIVARRFPIHTWLTNIDWTFEWHDTGTSLVVKRGDPLFYCQFEAMGADRAIHLVPTEPTPPIREWMERMDAATVATEQARLLLQAAENARPAQLLTPITR